MLLLGENSTGCFSTHDGARGRHGEREKDPRWEKGRVRTKMEIWRRAKSAISLPSSDVTMMGSDGFDDWGPGERRVGGFFLERRDESAIVVVLKNGFLGKNCI